MKLNSNSSASSSSQQDLNFNLKKLVENYINNDENKHEFEFFLTIIKQKQSNSDFVSKLLAELRRIVDRFEPNHFDNNLINLLFFEIKWSTYSKNKPVLNLLTEFLVDLNSAKTMLIMKPCSLLLKI